MNIRMERAFTPAHEEAVTGLILGRAAWLGQNKDTRQWQQAWPDEKGRAARIREGITGGHTYVGWAEGEIVLTATIYLLGNPKLWTAEERETVAVYLHRLVVRDDYAGQKLGGELIDWAAKLGYWLSEGQAELIRLDAWSDNEDLHTYYEAKGFRLVDVLEEKDEDAMGEIYDCPSGAKFERVLDPGVSTERLGDIS
jgi:GNAT superfamily N-acetyltransferase